jgi:hypothetical protein
VRWSTLCPRLAFPPRRRFGPRRAVVLEPLTLTLDDGRAITVPRGMLTDGRSGPVCAIMGGPYETPYLPAYLVHDYLCYRAQMWGPGDMRATVRRRADDLLRACLVDLGAWRATAAAVWAGVRAGAWASRRAPTLAAVPLLDPDDVGRAFAR